MRIVLTTGPRDAFAGIFWQAYREAEGPPLAAVFVVAGKKRAKEPLWQRAATPVALCGIGGCVRLAAAVAKVPFPRDRAAGLHRDRESLWPGDPEVRSVASMNAPESLAALQALAPDLLVSVHTPQIFKPAVLAAARVAAINVHNGRIPLYRGSFGTFWEVMEGERTGYVSIHEMVEEVDSGRMVAAATVDLHPPGGFLDVMVEKKRAGGALLARLLREVSASGRLPEGIVGEGTPAERTGLYPMPRFADVMAFARKRAGR